MCVLLAVNEALQALLGAGKIYVIETASMWTTGAEDQFSLIVYDKNGVPYHSVPASALQGGNVVVHNK